MALVRRILAGDGEAALTFEREYWKYLRHTLLAKCHDGRSKDQAEEVVADVMAECFGVSEKGNLLERYNGESSLRGWLYTIASNRMKNWWRSSRFRLEQQVEDTGAIEQIFETAPAGGAAESARADADVVELLHKAFEIALHFIERRDRLLLGMVYGRGLTQAEAGKIAGCDTSTVGRRIKAASARLREKMLRYLEILDVEIDIEWEDCEEMCTRWPDLLS